MDGNEGFDSLYNYEIVDECSNSDSESYTREELFQQDVSSDRVLNESIRKPTEGEIDEFLENVKTLVSEGINPALSKSISNCSISPNEDDQKPKHDDHVQDFTSQSLIKITSRDINIIDNEVVCTISTNINNNRSRVSYKPGGSLVKTIFNECPETGNKIKPSKLNEINESVKKHTSLVAETSVYSKEQIEHQNRSSDLAFKQTSLGAGSKIKDSYNCHKLLSPGKHSLSSNLKQHSVDNNKRSHSPIRNRERRYRSRSRSRERRKTTRSRSPDRQKFKRSLSRDKHRISSRSLSQGSVINLSPSPARFSSRNDLINHSQIYQENLSINMASNASNLYSRQAPYVSPMPPPYQGNPYSSNMGFGGIQQIPVGSMTTDPLSQFPGYSVPPAMNVPLAMNAPPAANLSYGSFPSGGGYTGPPSSVGYSGQQGYPGYYPSNEGTINRQKDSWGMPPPYTAAEPSIKEKQPNIYSSSSLASTYDSWKQSSSDRLSEINKDVHKKRKSRSRSKSKESRKSHKKKSKRRSKSPDSLSSRGNKKYRYSKSPPDYRKHSHERTKLLIDPNRIPTPPPPPILRGYDNSAEKINEAKTLNQKAAMEKKTESKSTNSKTYIQKNILDVENASLSSLLEAVMENSGVGKSQVNDPKVKKEIINNCETQIRQLYKKRITGFGAFIPDLIEPRQVNYRCSPLIMFHPNLSFNESSEETQWRCPGIRVPDVKLVKQEIIQKLPEPAASLHLKDGPREIKGNDYNVTKIHVTQVPLNSFSLGGGPVPKPEPVPPLSAPIPAVIPPTSGFVPPVTGPLPPLMPGPIGLDPCPGPVPPVQEPTWQAYNAPNLPVSYPTPVYNSHNWSSGYNTSWQNSNQGSFSESGYSYPQGYPLRYPSNPTEAKNFEGPTYNVNQKDMPYSMQGFNPNANIGRFDFLDSESSRDQKKYSQSKRRSSSPRKRNHSPRRRIPSPRRRNLSPRRRVPSPRRRSPLSRKLSISPVRRRSPGSLRRRRSPSPLRLSPSPTKSPLRRHSSPRRRSPTQRKAPMSGRGLSPRRHSPHKDNKSVLNEIDSKSKTLVQQPQPFSKPPVVQVAKKSANYSGRGTNANLTVLQLTDSVTAYSSTSSSNDHSNSIVLTTNSNQKHIETVNISEEDIGTKQALPLDSAVAPINQDDVSSNSNKVSGISESECEYHKSDKTGITEFNTDAKKLNKEKTEEHRSDADKSPIDKMKSHDTDNSPLTFQSLYALSSQIRAIQEKSLLNKSIIDSIEKKEHTYRRLYCLKSNMLCKIEKRSKKLKIVVPRDNVKEFIEIIHKKYHDFTQIQLANAIMHYISPAALYLRKKISAVFSQCPTCKDSQQNQKELTLTDLKGQKKPLNKTPKKIDTKPSQEMKKSITRTTPRSNKSSLTSKSSSCSKTSNYRSERSEHGRPSGYEKATKLKAPIVKANDKRLSTQQESNTTNQVLSNVSLSSIAENTITTKIETGMKDELIINIKEEKLSSYIDETKAADLISLKELKLNELSVKPDMEKLNNQKEGINGTSNQRVSVEEPSKNQVLTEMTPQQVTKKDKVLEPLIKCEQSVNKVNLRATTSKNEDGLRSHEPSIQVTESSKKADSGLDFKTRIRNIQMNNEEFKEIISALESKRKGGIYDSYVLKAGMLCTKNISEGVIDIRILAPPSSVEEVISIIHTMSAVHTPSTKVITFFSKHFSPVENIEALITTFVNNCQICKK